MAVAIVAGSASTAAENASPCADPAYRQFDFWLGEWEVRDSEGTVVGASSITSVLGGCALHENWRGAAGNVGYSYNIYDRGSGHWHQSWVDAQGGLLLLDGGLDDAGTMRLRGESAGQDGSPVLNEIAWTLLDDGRVRQHWRGSRDGGATWGNVFDGYYTRVE